MTTETKEPVNAMQFVEESMKEYSSLDSTQKLQNSQMDHEINLIRAKYSGYITELAVKKEEVYTRLRDFATSNDSMLFSVKRSLATKYGTFGFRKGKTRFTLVGANNWNTITVALRTMLPEYVRTEYTAAKDKLLYDANLPEVNKFFPVLGIALTQDENFYIDTEK